MSTASGVLCDRLCYRLKHKQTQTKSLGAERDELFPRNKGKGAKLLQCRLFRQQALLYITLTGKPGWAFYQLNLVSCLQEQSAEGSKFFPCVFPCLRRPLLLPLLLEQCKAEATASSTDCPGALLPSLPPTSRRGASRSHPKSSGLHSGSGKEAPVGWGGWRVIWVWWDVGGCVKCRWC